MLMTSLAAASGACWALAFLTAARVRRFSEAVMTAVSVTVSAAVAAAAVAAAKTLAAVAAAAVVIVAAVVVAAAAAEAVMAAVWDLLPCRAFPGGGMVCAGLARGRCTVFCTGVVDGSCTDSNPEPSVASCCCAG